MTWVARSVEERLARAAENGELAAPSLEGKPISDIDRSRSAGWWAERFVAREKSHDRREAAQRDVARARAGFWRCADVDELRVAVVRANTMIDTANVNLVASDRISPFDLVDITARWRRLRR